MFDFLDSDWFNIGLQVVFLVLLVFDVKKYRETKKNEYLLNIVLTIGFAIWVLYPYYNSYIEWTDAQKSELLAKCDSDKNSTKLCKCIEDATFKNYSYLEYNSLDKNSSEYIDFLEDARKDCLDDSWF